MIPVRSERIYSIQSVLKCARRELKLYIFTEVYDVILVRAWRRYAAQIHEWMFPNKVNFSGFPCSGSREQWTLCREHVNRNTVHAWSALLTSWLSESGVLTKRDMQNMQSGGARGLELRTSAETAHGRDMKNEIWIWKYVDFSSCAGSMCSWSLQSKYCQHFFVTLVSSDCYSEDRSQVAVGRTHCRVLV